MRFVVGVRKKTKKIEFVEIEDVVCGGGKWEGRNYMAKKVCFFFLQVKIIGNHSVDVQRTNSAFNDEISKLWRKENQQEFPRN